MNTVDAVPDSPDQGLLEAGWGHNQYLGREEPSENTYEDRSLLRIGLEDRMKPWNEMKLGQSFELPCEAEERIIKT